MPGGAHAVAAGGPADAPTVVLLHGFPSSSHMYRNLIPALADRYRVVAPDYLGSGHSDAPSVRDFEYSFESITAVTAELLDHLGLDHFALYVQDFGAPIGFRIASRNPDKVTAIITQNGNAYNEGLNPGLRAVLTGANARDHVALRDNITLAFTKGMYLNGVPDTTLVSPDTWLIDQTLLDRPGADEIALALLADYPTNLALYPDFQKYLRDTRVPLLAVWGGNDEIFVADGARAFTNDLPDAEVHLLDTGHFALETHLDAIAGYVRGFLGRVLTGAK